MILPWIALAVFIISVIAGIGLSILGIGGAFVILAGAILYNLITWSFTISLNLLIWLFTLAVLGELIEYGINIVSIKKSSTYSMAGMVVGAILCAVAFVPIPFGPVIGVFVGATLGAYVMEYIHTNNAKKAWKAAKNVLFGRIMVSLTKTVLAFVQVWLVAGAIN